MFSRLLTITWFIITIAPASMTTDTNTPISVTDPAESTALTDTTMLSGTPGPPTLDTSAQVPVDSTTSDIPTGYSTMETGLTDGYSPVSSSTLTKTHSASPVTHSNWVSMDMITESEHSSLASTISPGSTSSSPVTSTDWVPMDVATTAVYGPILSPTSPENNTTVIKSTSEYVAMETTTVRISTTSAMSPGFDFNTSTPKSMGGSVTVEEITEPTHDRLVSSTSPENDTVPTKIPKNVTTDPEFSSGFFSASTSESDFSNPSTNHVTMETATAYISIAPSTPEETYSTAVTNTELNTLDTITVSPHKPVSVSPEMNSDGYERTSFQTAVETATSSTNKAAVSLTINESTTPYQVTITNVTSTVYIPGVPQTSQEDDHTSSVPRSTQVTQQKATTLVHNNISTSPENHYDTSITSSITSSITLKTTVDMPTATSTSLENYSTIPASTPNRVTVETVTNFSDNLTVFPTSENYFFTPTSDYTAYIPVATSVTPAAGFSTPLGTSPETVTTSVYNPTKSTTSVIDADTTFPQGPATTQGLENTSVTESPGQGTSEMSTNPSTSTPVDQTTMVMTEISVTTVAGPSGPPADATSTVATAMSDQSTSSTVTRTTMLVPITNTGIPEQSSSRPIVPITESTTVPTTTSPPVRPGGFCPSNPCPFNSVCLELSTSFSCLCLAGSYFSGGRCIQARVFPGILHIKTLDFQSEMSNRSSQTFQEAAAMISQELGMALMDHPGYVKTLVQELREGSVVASVDNIFKLDSNATKQSTIGAIDAAIQGCAGNCSLLTRAEFNATDLCKQKLAPCDLQTTNCVFQDNGTAKCICKEGYIPSLYSNTSCAACLSGERSENWKCVPCPFGYGGFNCHDSYLLAMVVISCVLGSLLLILLLAFISYCLRRSLPKSSYNSSYLSDEMSSVWPHQDLTHIPRASSSWDPTQMEMMETGNAGSELGSKLHGNGAMESCSVVPEDMRTFKGKNSSRYSYLIQGHQNPYFIADEMKITT